MKMHKTLSIAVLALSTALAANTLWALDPGTTPPPQIDTEMAAKISPMVSMLDQKGLVEHSCKIAPEDALKMMTAGKEKVTLLDVRTPAEMGVVGLTFPNAIQIPMADIMKPESLDKLPKDGQILVICHSGNRAAGVTALLSAVGFRNVKYVNGGLIALVTQLTPKALPY
jgi:rhodanese-related sulfurtransferase